MKLFNKEELYQFNLSWMNYKVIFLSDLTDNILRSINHRFLAQEELPCPRGYQFLSIKPSKKSFELWNRFI